MDEIQNQNPSTETEAQKKSKTKVILIVIAVVAVLMIARGAFFSPERAAERAFERATGGQYDFDKDGGGSIKIKGEDGSQIEVSGEGQGKLPKDWPSSVPLPGDAKIEYGGTMSDGSGAKNLTVTYSTKDSAEDVSEYYTDKLSSNGWTIEANLTTGDGAMISAKNGETVAVAYISSDANGSSVSLNVQVKE